MGRSRPIIVLIMVILISVTAGCARQSAEKKPAENSQNNKAPKELKSLGSDLDTVIAELDKKIKARSSGAMQQEIQLNPRTESSGGESQTGQPSAGQPSSQQSGQQQGQQQNNQKQGSQSSSTQKQKQSSQGEGEESNGQEGGSGGGPGQSQGGEKSQNTVKTGPTGAQTTGPAAPPTEAGNDWQKEFTSMRKIHESWNSLMPEAVEAGMGIEARHQFTAALEQLTQAITARQPEASMTAALELYKNYSDLPRFFPGADPSEFHRLKYEVMAAVYESSQKNWSKAEEHVPKMQEQWLYLGAKAKDADPKLLRRTEFSIMDLQNAIKTRQTDLIMIKGEIAMTNLSNLQSKISSQAGGPSQSTGQGQSADQGQSSGQGGGNSSGPGS